MSTLPRTPKSPPSWRWDPHRDGAAGQAAGMEVLKGQGWCVIDDPFAGPIIVRSPRDRKPGEPCPTREEIMGYYRAGDSMQLVSSHVPGLGLPSSTGGSSVPTYLSPNAPAYGAAAAELYGGQNSAGWGAPSGWRTYRRMNPGNVRALRRSMRRVQAFAKLAKATIQFTHRVKMKKRGRSR